VRYHGASLLRRATLCACASSCDEVAVILGHAHERIAPEVAGLRATVLVEQAWAEGIGRTIRTAAQWAMHRGWGALVLVACDQPRLFPEHIDSLVAEHAVGEDVAASTYDGVRGIPAIFGAGWFARLASLRGERGAGGLLRAHPKVGEVPWPDGAFDVDTEQDARRLTEPDDGDEPRSAEDAQARSVAPKRRFTSVTTLPCCASTSASVRVRSAAR
jgi:CTP:molybdopterin cytidylyltransferase MocA